jgi:hypothetical protein
MEENWLLPGTLQQNKILIEFSGEYSFGNLRLLVVA